MEEHHRGLVTPSYMLLLRNPVKAPHINWSEQMCFITKTIMRCCLAPNVTFILVGIEKGAFLHGLVSGVVYVY